MPKRRVLLVCSNHLFGESMEKILRAEKDVELIGPLGLGDDVGGRITESSPDAILIADEDSQSEAAANLTSAILEKNPNLPIIRAGLTENVVRVHSTHILPASGADLLETIRNLPAISAGKSSDERSK
ncbi:response regulator transcription factor [Chloroflexi bacterium CFX5]|nr:response regulator transcription factor [Chloroflexi bacterium CFX5]